MKCHFRIPISYVLLLSCLLPARDCFCASKSLPRGRNLAWRNGLKNGLASAGAAACVKTLLQPIDAIKTVQQYNDLGFMDATRQLYARNRLASFYSGLGVTVVGAMPSVALYFGVYSYCKQLILKRTRHKKAGIALSAAIGNTIASASRVPYEVMKQKLQANLYGSTMEMFREMVAHPSLASELLFPKGGLLAQILRDVPYAIVTMLLYESLQTLFQDGRNSASDFVLGGAAGGFGSYVTTPMDVIKTKLQTNQALYHGSVWRCVRDIYHTTGLWGFLTGSVPRLMHKVPANAFFFVFYEFFKRVLRVESGGQTGTVVEEEEKR